MMKIELPQQRTGADRIRPRKGDWVRGVCAADGKERSGRFMGLIGHLPVIRTRDGAEWPVLVLDDMEPYAMICRHGLKVVEPVPAEHDESLRPHLPSSRPTRYCPACFPVIRQVDPWPCTPECLADFEKQQEAEIEEYWEGVNDLMRTQYE